MSKQIFLIGVLSCALCASALSAPLRAAAPQASSQQTVAAAAERNDLDAIRTLLKSGADVNAAQGDGMTALHWASLNGDVKIADVLLTAGATIEPLTRIGRYTPLHLASSRGHAAVVARLLAAGGKPGALTSTGLQPLHLAAQAGNADAVSALIARGADVNAVDETHGRTPLVFAVSQNRLEAMKVLLAKGADPKLGTKVIDYQARAQADNAARAARDRVVTAQTGRAPDQIQNGSIPNVTGGGAGRAGAPAANVAGGGRQGRGGGGQDPDDPDIPQRAAPARGGDPNAPRPVSDIQQIGKQGGFTALHYAAREGYTNAALLLVESGVDINTGTAGDRSTPMLVAIINGQYDLARALLSRGANPNLDSDDGVGPLFAVLNNEWALRTWYPQPTAGAQQKASYLQLMEDLLKAGADPNERTRSHVWYAAYNAGRMGIDFTGATPFWRAAYALDVEAMRLLMKYGADPDLRTMSFGSAMRPNDPSGLPRTPVGGPHVPAFHAASGVGYGTSRVAQQHRTVPDGWMAAAKFFVEELNVDINMRDADGFTALHHAAARGDNEMIKYLVGKGANVMAVNRAGQTTVDMANSPEQRTQPFPETIKLLEGMGAKNNHNCRACGN